MWFPTSYYGVRCVQVLGPPAPFHINHLNTTEELQEGRNFKGANVRLQRLTEQLHAKISCEDISISVGNKQTSAEPWFSKLNQLGRQGVMKRGRKNSKVAVSECQVCNRTGPPAQSMQDSLGSGRTPSFSSFIKPNDF